MQFARQFAEELLAKADIRINGGRPWDVQIHNEKLFSHVIRSGSLGLGESYMDGWWDAEELDQCIFRLLSHNLEKEIRLTPKAASLVISNLLVNKQRSARAYDIGKQHYDVGNDMYQAMLDKRLTYTCGYWNSPEKRSQTLDEAQEAKLDLICRKIGLAPGMQVLDIGCGWGSFAKYAAEKYGAIVTGVTVSEEQVKLGEKLCSGLPATIRFQDYRQVSGTFDRIVSIGMFEHVGYKNYRTFMKKARELLKDDGLLLLHTIGSNYSRTSGDPWLNKYIFPGGMLPSIKQIGSAIEGQFVMEDWHNFGADYDKTLMAWYKNFDAAWPELQQKYGDRFYRMWKYYLLSCAGSFRARRIQLWQIVLSPKGVPQGYESIR